VKTAPLDIEVRAAELQEAAVECVAKAFPRLGDREDIAQDAYEALYRQAKAGARITDPESQICTIAWRLANRRVRPDRSAVYKAAPVDPSGRTLGAIPDETASSEEQLIAAADRAQAKAAVAELDQELAQIYYVRHVEGLSTSEACKRLGLAKSTYCHRTNRLYRVIHKALSPAGISDLQLKAYEALQNERPSKLRSAALEWRKSDPVFAAQCRALDRAHEELALLLPPAVLEASPEVSILQRVGEGVASARERIASLGGETSQAATETAMTAASSGAGRGAGATAGTAVAAIGGALGAKGVALCAGGAVTVACVAAVVVPGVGPFDENTRAPAAAQETAAAKPNRRPPEPPRVALAPPRVPHPSTRSGGSTGVGGSLGSEHGEGGGSAEDPDPAPRSAPTPANPSSPTDPTAYNPYSPTSPEPSAATSPTPSSAPSGGGSGDSSSSGGCNPYDPAC
jgi:DNA-directed RNA polymerase specialized sigma24 family protein